MTIAVCDSVLRIPLEAFSPVQLAMLKSDLTFKPIFKKDYGFGVKEPVVLYTIDDQDQQVIIPRSYPLADLSSRGFSIDFRLVEGLPVEFQFNEDAQVEEPNKKVFQDGLIKTFMDALTLQGTPYKGGLLCAPCGSGKTAMAIKLASMLGRKTLILVNKEFFLDQWRDEIVKFTNLERSDIGIIQQNKCDWKGRKITIAMLQSICSHVYPRDMYRDFGVVICDEAHRIGTPVWSRAMAMFPAKYRIGVTATPRRKDGMQKALKFGIGDVLAKGTQYGLLPRVNQLLRHTNIPDSFYITLNSKGDVQTTAVATFLRFLIRKESRNQWLVELMLTACKAGRKIFILSDRREHLNTLLVMFRKMSNSAFTSGLYVGGLGSKVLVVSASCQAIFGTYQMAAEGLNIPAMDTLFFATPHSDVEQASGRILRNHDGKHTPVIVDPVDDIPLCLDWGQKRLEQYDRLGFILDKTINYETAGVLHGR